MNKEKDSAQPKLSELEIALAEVSNQVYAASGMIEQLEHDGKVSGNGHHKRQELAIRAQMLVFISWKNEQEKEELSPTHPVKEALSRKE